MTMKNGNGKKTSRATPSLGELFWYLSHAPQFSLVFILRVVDLFTRCLLTSLQLASALTLIFFICMIWTLTKTSSTLTKWSSNLTPTRNSNARSL